MQRPLAIMLLAALAMGASIGGAAADRLSGGPLVAMPGVASAISCEIFNGGSSTAVIRENVILNSSGASQTLTNDTCGATLLQRRSCYFSAAVVPGEFYACRLRVDEDATMLRGNAQLRDSSGGTVAETPMR